MSEEIPLAGGNVSAGVVRVGDTVRRPSGYWTPAVHALLTHLHQVGFTGAPRPLGTDERGREVLTFVPGAAAWPDQVERLAPADQIARVARLVRDFHDAVSSFTPPPDARWQRLIPAEGADIIAHHDLAPWNLILGDRWVFIDWDVAGPGSRLWDVAYAIKTFVPLSADVRFAAWPAEMRVATFADAYGLSETQRRALVPMLARRAQSMHDFLQSQAALGVEPWTRLWRDGHGLVWRADAEHIAARESRYSAALGLT